MAFLKPDKIRREYVGNDVIEINEKLIPDGAVANKYIASWVKKGWLVKPNALLNDGKGIPKAITIHNTEDIQTHPDTNPAEQYARATYPNGNMGGVVVHFWVHKNVIWQQLRENESGWHARDGVNRRLGHDGSTYIGGNVDTIAIECVGKDEETEVTAARLTAYLCNKYNLNPKEDVYTHNYWMHGEDRFIKGADKNCPVYILPHWELFLQTVYEFIDSEFKVSRGDKVELLKTIRLRKGEEYEVSKVKDGKAFLEIELRDGTYKKPEQQLKEGDIINVTKAVTYEGKPFKLWYSEYTIMSIKDDRAVIGVNGTVVAAVNINDLRKI